MAALLFYATDQTDVMGPENVVSHGHPPCSARGRVIVVTYPFGQDWFVVTEVANLLSLSIPLFREY